MNTSVNVFLPMRSGSERIKNKNTKKFSGHHGGLASIKIKQLLNTKMVNSIYISTDDPLVESIAKQFASDKINVVRRPDELASSAASTDDLVTYAHDIMPNGHILWTHVTSPFVNSKLYDSIIATYLQNLDSYDSLMTVTKLQKFIWKDNLPINYCRDREKWPRTQTLEPLWEVNSAAFIAPRNIYKLCKDRIGYSPLLYELNQNSAFDIDWPGDFKIAEALFSTKDLY